MSGLREVSREAGALLLDLLDQREPVLSPPALRDHYPAVGQELIDAGLLHPWGTELADVAVDGADEEPVAVLPSDHGYGYFSEASGWVEVQVGRLRRHRADIPLAIAAMTSKLDCGSPSSSSALATDYVWDLGAVQLLKRGPLTQIWFARRVADEQIVKELIDLARRRPPTFNRVILTSTPAESWAGISVPGNVVVSVRDILAHGAGLAIDPAILGARVGGLAEAPVGQILYLSPDRRSLVIQGKRIPLKSDIHRKIIEMLVAGRAEGRRYSAHELLDASGSEAGALHRAFGKKWKLLRSYLSSDGSGWGFDL